MDGLAQFNSIVGATVRTFFPFALALVVALGYARRLGRNLGVALETQARQSRREPVIGLASSTASVAFWSDPQTIIDGLQSLTLVLVLSLYVAFVPLVVAILFPHHETQLPRVVGDSLALPEVVLLSFWLNHLSRTYLSRVIRGFFAIVALNVFLTAIMDIGAPRSLWPITQWRFLLVQILLTADLSAYFSYRLGIFEGRQSASAFMKLPLVKVHTSRGETISNFRLYEKSDRDYRFIGADGEERIIPIAHVYQIVKGPPN